MSCALVKWFHFIHPPVQNGDSAKAVRDSAEAIRRNRARAPEVHQQSYSLRDQLERNHLAERLNAAMRKVHP